MSPIVFFLVPLAAAILVGLLRSAALETARPRRTAASKRSRVRVAEERCSGSLPGVAQARMVDQTH